MKYLSIRIILLGLFPIIIWAQEDTSSIPLFETLDEVSVDRDPGVTISSKSILSQELISEVELRKAACCDLSESFETNASISASFTDAVTGTRQIKLLGLEGPYALYTRGNLQTMGGLSSVLGMALIPGAWIQSIQLTKGPGSVVNGAGAMSGQINYELRPSFTKQKAHFNLFAGPTRFEQNAIYTWRQSPRWSSNIMIHGRQQLFRWDNNNDGYLDAPLSQHVFVQNAWKHNGKNSEAQFGVKVSAIKNIGGSALYGDPTLDSIWSHELQTERYELWAKRGYFLEGGINRSIGTQFSATYQDLDGYFGNLSFTGKEQRLYGNLIFQDNLWDTRHTFKGGLDLNAFVIEQQLWNRDGSFSGMVAGAYGEYSFVTSPDGQGLSMILGQRVDGLYTGNDGRFFYVPRLHVKYNIGPWVLRTQASKSYRIATLGGEYMGYMANSRGFNFTNLETTEGLNMPIERSTTFGTGITWTQDVFYKELQWYADVYLNTFDSKIIFDFDYSADSAIVSLVQNTVNRPYALSYQVGAQYELIHRTMVKAAYRYQEAKQRDLSGVTIGNGLEDVILNVPHLLYLGTSYSGPNGVGIEINATYNSSQRLPEIGYSKRSPAFTILDFQISKQDRKFGQLYVGLHNALNIRQLDPVLGGDLPFEDRFDASIVWGPIMGRRLYAGWRYDLRTE